MKIAGVCHLCGKPAMQTCASCGLITCRNCINGQSGLCYGCAPPTMAEDNADF